MKTLTSRAVVVVLLVLGLGLWLEPSLSRAADMEVDGNCSVTGNQVTQGNQIVMGSIGIGTSSIGARFQITTATPNIKLTGGTSDSCLIQFGDSGNTSAGMVKYSNSDDSLSITAGDVWLFLINNSAIVPRYHKTYNLGTDALSFGIVYADDFHNNGLLDFSDVSPLSFLKSNPPRPKSAGAFDAEKPAFKRAGVYAKELDPGSLPRELTGYYQLVNEWEQNTNPAWVRDFLSSDPEEEKNGDPGSGRRAPSEEEVQKHIERYRTTHTHPDQMEAARWGISLTQMASWNYKALHEVAGELEYLNRKVAALEQSRDAVTQQVRDLATGVIRVEDLAPGAENTAVVMRLTESVLRQLGVDPWVEITLADAIETGPETVESSVAKAVTKYRLNLETAQAEPYTVEETVTEQTPTGKTVKRVKSGVRFDEATGKAYRWVGLSSAGAAETLTALRTANQLATLRTANQLAALQARFVAPPSGGPGFVVPPSGGQGFVAPPSGGILSASASAATPANSKPAAR